MCESLKKPLVGHCSTAVFVRESDGHVDGSHLWAVGWSAVQLQLQLTQALLVLDLQGDCLQFFRVQLGVQSAHLPQNGGSGVEVSADATVSADSCVLIGALT